MDKYYKVIRADGKSPSAEFDYAPYLPNGGAPGKWLPEIPNPRKEGYYVSKYWNMWYADGMRIYEVEIRGEIFPDEQGAEKQVRCSQIRLLRDLTKSLLEKFFKSKTPDSAEGWNEGRGNSGLGNVGDSNTGNFNVGSRNTGNLNLGDFNTGDKNCGIDNVGDGNSGSGNVGCNNEGHSNSGNSNSGSFNSGSYNKGNGNSGSFNFGSGNVGKWNVGNYNAGFFNTSSAPFMIFNKPSPKGVSFSDIKLPKFLNKPNPKEAFREASADDLKMVLSLPNFDFEIFEKITGISKSDFDKKLNGSASS